jgi:hypothetical protein
MVFNRTYAVDYVRLFPNLSDQNHDCEDSAHVALSLGTPPDSEVIKPVACNFTTTRTGQEESTKSYYWGSKG